MGYIVEFWGVGFWCKYIYAEKLKLLTTRVTSISSRFSFFVWNKLHIHTNEMHDKPKGGGIFISKTNCCL